MVSDVEVDEGDDGGLGGVSVSEEEEEEDEVEEEEDEDEEQETRSCTLIGLGWTGLTWVEVGWGIS